MIFEQDDGPIEKAGTVIGAIISLAVYALLLWTVLSSIM
jgi:hypothetical protein